MTWLGGGMNLGLSRETAWCRFSWLQTLSLCMPCVLVVRLNEHHCKHPATCRETEGHLILQEAPILSPLQCCSGPPEVQVPKGKWLLWLSWALRPCPLPSFLLSQLPNTQGLSAKFYPAPTFFPIDRNSVLRSHLLYSCLQSRWFLVFFWLHFLEPREGSEAPSFPVIFPGLSFL